MRKWCDNSAAGASNYGSMRPCLSGWRIKGLLPVAAVSCGKEQQSKERCVPWYAAAARRGTVWLPPWSVQLHRSQHLKYPFIHGLYNCTHHNRIYCASVSFFSLHTELSILLNSILWNLNTVILHIIRLKTDVTLHYNIKWFSEEIFDDIGFHSSFIIAFLLFMCAPWKWPTQLGLVVGSEKFPVEKISLTW